MAPLQCLDVARAAWGEPLRRAGQECFYRCPHPKHDDQHPSLQINQQKNVWMCGPCGASGNAWQLAAFIGGLDPSDKTGVGWWLRKHGLSKSQNGNGSAITVDDLALDKSLPAEFLRNLGLQNVPEGVLIPYCLIDGSQAPRHRLRTALVAKAGSRWGAQEGPIVPYGLERLSEAQNAGFSFWWRVSRIAGHCGITVFLLSASPERRWRNASSRITSTRLRNCSLCANQTRGERRLFMPSRRGSRRSVGAEKFLHFP